MKMRKLLCVVIAFVMVVSLVPMLSLGIGAQEGITVSSDDGNYSITLEKTEFKKGEPVYASAQGLNVKDWVGICKAGSNSYIDYYYLGQSGMGTPYDLLKVLALDPGEYELFLAPSTAMQYSEATVKGVFFTVTDEEYTGENEIPLVDIGDASRLYTKDGQKEFKKGEPIYIAATGDGSDWIGIYDDVYDESYSSYVYISGMGGSGNYYNLNKSGDMVPGTYFIRLMPANASNSPYSIWAVAGIYITITDEEYVPPVVEEELDPETGKPVDFGINPSRLTLEKKIFKKGEPILVSAISSTDKDWVGIYEDGVSTQSIKYHYVSLANSGVYMDVAQGQTLPAGDYLIRLVPNDENLAGNEANTIAGVWIIITDEVYNPDEGGTTDPEPDPDPDPDNPDEGGDDVITGDSVTVSNSTHSMTVNKTKFDVGEEIWVSAIGVHAKDWIGIAERGYTEGTIRWYYITSAGNGVPYNIKKAPNIGSQLNHLADIPEGLYTIYFVEKDAYLRNGFTFSINISVGNVDDPENGKTVGGTESEPTDELLPPVNVTYDKTGENGYAGGTVTVTMPSGSLTNRAIVMYWADANGKLEGYTAHARFKVTGETVTFTFTDSMVIPKGATRLLVYTQNEITGELSSECFSLDLPESSAMEESNVISSFWIISDIHIGRTETSAVNFKRMLKEAIKFNPNGTAIFIVGDMADHGSEAEFAQMVALHKEVMDEMGKDVGDYPLFLTLGNHDYPAMSTVFLSYAKLPDGTSPTDTNYDFWLNGYHYIFLGSDTNAGLQANLTEETLLWLDAKLNECRDPSRPTFVFLHQPMYNTVSGSLPGEGWHGVANEDALRSVLKKYPEVMMFNGHTHWTMDSKGNIFEGTEELPIHIFNCASVSYLWSGYNYVTGENLDGSQGYYIEICDDKIMVRGRDFINGQWISSAQYCIELEDSTLEAEHSYTDVSLTYENGYLQNGTLVSLCSVCGYEQVTVTEPMITFSGYSVSKFNNSGICAGYVFDFDLLERYEELNNTTVLLGFVASPYEYLVNEGCPINPDGTVGEITQGMIVNEALLRDYAHVDIILRSSDWTQYGENKTVFCAYYIENGEVKYLCSTDTAMSKADYITYNSLIEN